MGARACSVRYSVSFVCSEHEGMGMGPRQQLNVLSSRARACSAVSVRVGLFAFWTAYLWGGSDREDARSQTGLAPAKGTSDSAKPTDSVCTQGRCGAPLLARAASAQATNETKLNLTHMNAFELDRIEGNPCSC